MQMTLPGVPSIYYGDEYALEGLSDPGNRRTLPTPDAVHDRDMLNMVCLLYTSQGHRRRRKRRRHREGGMIR